MQGGSRISQRIPPDDQAHAVSSGERRDLRRVVAGKGRSSPSMVSDPLQGVAQRRQRLLCACPHKAQRAWKQSWAAFLSR